MDNDDRSMIASKMIHFLVKNDWQVNNKYIRLLVKISDIFLSIIWCTEKIIHRRLSLARWVSLVSDVKWMTKPMSPFDSIVGASIEQVSVEINLICRRWDDDYNGGQLRARSMRRLLAWEFRQCAIAIVSSRLDAVNFIDEDCLGSIDVRCELIDLWKWFYIAMDARRALVGMSTCRLIIIMSMMQSDCCSCLTFSFSRTLTQQTIDASRCVDHLLRIPSTADSVGLFLFLKLTNADWWNPGNECFSSEGDAIAFYITECLIILSGWICLLAAWIDRQGAYPGETTIFGQTKASLTLDFHTTIFSRKTKGKVNTLSSHEWRWLFTPSLKGLKCEWERCYFRSNCV